MIAFKSLLIFLIILIYQATGNGEDITNQYITEIKGVLNCSLENQLPTNIIGIYINSSKSLYRLDHIESKFVGYDKEFHIKAKTYYNKKSTNTNYNEKPKLYFYIRTSCFKEHENSGCTLNTLTREIPSDYIIPGHGKQVKFWEIGYLKLPKPGKHFKESCSL